MFKVTKTADNRLDIEFAGKLNSDDMRIALDELEVRAEGIEHGRMLYRIGEFDFPTFGAIGVELARLPVLFKIMRNFDRVAVVADQKWVQAASEIEGALIPGLVIKAFDIENQTEAETWLMS